MEAKQLIENETKPNEVFAVFVGSIDSSSTRNLLGGLSRVTVIEPAITHLHLLFQSSGGNVSDGIFIYNALRSFPIELTAYNSGGVLSIATIAYLGARNRKVSKYAAFMLHRTITPLANGNAGALVCASNVLTMDDERTQSILKAHMTITGEQWDNLRNYQFWLTAADAVKSGLATEIGDFAPPPGARIFSFNEIHN